MGVWRSATATSSQVAPFPVLLYHAVDTSWPRGQEDITVSPELFARHMDVLVERGLRVIPLGQVAAALLAGAALPTKAVSVTFDDGYACLLRHAHPVLAERRMAASLFQTTGCIGGSFSGSDMVSEADLRELADLGIEIGAHTVTHPHLDLVSPQRVDVELRDSRDRLEQVLGAPVAGVAYPHGSYTRHVVAAAGRAGYQWAAGVKNASSHAADDPWAIARITMGSTVATEDLRRILDGGAPMAWPGERLRTTVFRQVRRLRTREGYDPNVL